MAQPNQPTDPMDFAPDDLAAAGALPGEADPGYVWPKDPRTLAALEHWQDLKVGVIIHWGIYSHLGQGGSWSLHRQHLGAFTDPPLTWSGTDEQYHTWYADQARLFTGTEYDPAQWARMCADAGLKYLVFTAKHHDGFAMYDSAYTNFKCTAEDAGLRRDVFADTVTAFRAAGLETGVYFSKADWNHPGYWNRARPITDRFHNYDIDEQPQAWAGFVEYTHRQIEELLTRYGPMALLWLDAGWVRAPYEPIDIDAIGARARELQPDILVVDREVPGPEMNYRTPEQQVPDETWDYPWESCITMTRSWCSTSRDDPTKPASEIIGNLVRIVARGGNYLIGVGPDATGHLSAHVRKTMAELGDFLRTCGTAIYATRPAPATLAARGGLEWHLTCSKPGSGPPRINVIGLCPSDTVGPSRMRLSGVGPVRSVRILGSETTPLWTSSGPELEVEVPAAPTAHAVVIAVDLAAAS